MKCLALEQVCTARTCVSHVSKRQISTCLSPSILNGGLGGSDGRRLKTFLSHKGIRNGITLRWLGTFPKSINDSEHHRTGLPPNPGHSGGQQGWSQSLRSLFTPKVHDRTIRKL